jgi:hypothetical protein
MISPIRLRPIDWSIVQFAVLMLCTLGGIFCAFHFGDAHEVARVLVTLRERTADPPPRYRAPLISVENSAPAKIQRTEWQPRSERSWNLSRIVTQSPVGTGPVSTPAIRGSGLPNDPHVVGVLEQASFNPETTVGRVP